MVAKKQHNIGNKVELFLKEIITGNFFIKRFIIKQVGVFALAVALAFFYMNNRMICERSYKEIHRLRKELTEQKHIALLSESQLLSVSRIGTIKNLIKKHQLNLIEENYPAYKITLPKPNK